MKKEVLGRYFGTEIDGRWWRRYRKDKKWASGKGVFSYDENEISFLRLLARNPFVIKFSDVISVEPGKWHAGHWGTGKRKIIKIMWHKGGKHLISGFSLRGNEEDLDKIIAELREKIPSNPV